MILACYLARINLYACSNNRLSRVLYRGDNSGQAQAWGATDMPGRSARNDIWIKSDLA